MKLFSVGRVPRGLLLISLLSFTNGFCQDSSTNISALDQRSCNPSVSQPSRAYPSLELGCGRELSYLGTYSAEAKYLPLTRNERWHNQDNLDISAERFRPAEVPPFINLHSREYRVESYLPPIHATKAVKGQSRLASFRDNLVTLVYGREKVLLAPHHVVVDSKGRVIITDPAAGAVHVLNGDQSLRIVTGPSHRVQRPNGVAVDADDNIYVADQDLGLVVVFATDGTFLRYIGKLGNETLFHFPTGIAIDRVNGRLYVLDTERHLLFQLDLQGNVIKRIGRFKGNDVVVDFEFPTEVAVNGNKIVVLDADSSRVSVINDQGTLERQFNIGLRNRHEIVDKLGVGLDADANIYVSNMADSSVRIYKSDGRLLGSFGEPGTQSGEFNSPTGLWIDSSNRLYIAEEGNRRVQVFQMTMPAPSQLALGF